jgi:hypothetical protein
MHLPTLSTSSSAEIMIIGVIAVSQGLGTRAATGRIVADY